MQFRKDFMVLNFGSSSLVKHFNDLKRGIIILFRRLKAINFSAEEQQIVDMNPEKMPELIDARRRICKILGELSRWVLNVQPLYSKIKFTLLISMQKENSDPPLNSCILQKCWTESETKKLYDYVFV